MRHSSKWPQTKHSSNTLLSQTEGKHGKETCVIHQNDLQTKHSSTASDNNKPALIQKNNASPLWIYRERQTDKSN